jgi:hypothetical protein
MKIKRIAPKRLVMIPRGISLGNRVLPIVSLTRRNRAPIIIDPPKA